MSNEQIALILIVANFVVSAAFMVRGSLKARRLFQSPGPPNFLFREKGASGYSTKNFLCRLGGARNVLDIGLTETELWIRGSFSIITYIGMMYDLCHRIPLERLLHLHVKGHSVEIRFNDAHGKCHTLILDMKRGIDLAQCVQQAKTVLGG